MSRGEMVFPVAHLLEKAGTPFLFVTGYGQAILPRDRPDWEACPKPFHPDELTGRLAQKVNVPEKVRKPMFLYVHP